MLIFFFDPRPDGDRKGLGSSMIWREKNSAATTVDTMDLAKYILDHVAKRRFATSPSLPGRVLAKLDIEGYEHTLLPNLFMTTAICIIDKIFLEVHGFGKYEEVSDKSVEDMVSFFRYMAHASKVCI